MPAMRCVTAMSRYAQMGITTGLFGNYNLTEAQIDAKVATSIGNYLLGNAITSDGSLVVRYTGAQTTI
jgi:hypothetical protein